MFDPTVFENLKVAVENHVYDRDNITGEIRILGRIDRVEMSVMSRTFAIRFESTEQKGVIGELMLEASLKELAAEILEVQGEFPGCQILLRYYIQLEEQAAKHCEQIDRILNEIWKPDLPPVQTLSFVYGHEPIVYTNTAEIRFRRKINEDQMGDIPNLIDHMIRTVQELSRI